MDRWKGVSTAKGRFLAGWGECARDCVASFLPAIRRPLGHETLSLGVSLREFEVGNRFLCGEILGVKSVQKLLKLRSLIPWVDWIGHEECLGCEFVLVLVDYGKYLLSQPHGFSQLLSDDGESDEWMKEGRGCFEPLFVRCSVGEFWCYCTAGMGVTLFRKRIVSFFRYFL